MQYYFKFDIIEEIVVGKNQLLYTQDMNVHVSDNNIQDISAYYISAYAFPPQKGNHAINIVHACHKKSHV